MTLVNICSMGKYLFKGNAIDVRQKYRLFASVFTGDSEQVFFLRILISIRSRKER